MTQATDLAEPTGGQETEGCLWIYGDPRTDPLDWRFCGRPKVSGKSYCVGHGRRVWGTGDVPGKTFRGAAA